jgi:hypothetical protein
MDGNCRIQVQCSGGSFAVRQASRSIARSTRHASRCRANRRDAATTTSTAAAAGTNSTIPTSPSQAVMPTKPAASHGMSPTRTNPGGSLRA